jgi:hypothetical protein
MDPLDVLAHSRALWNREKLELGSDEVLAQILDRGSLEDWRALYRLLGEADGGARRLGERIGRLLESVPLPYPHFWRAALASRGFAADWSRPVKGPPGAASI